MAQFANSLMTHHLPIRIEDLRDILKDKPLTSFSFVNEANIVPPTAQNLFQDSGRLKCFMCDIVLSTSAKVAAIQTDFYDTSGVPTGTEDKLFGIISFVTKDTGVNEGFSQHNYQFPERGIAFEHGIGLICTALINSPTIIHVDATFGYVKTSDDYIT